MRNSVLPFKTGNYKFTLIAVTNSAMFSENKSYTIVNGTNSLSFTPHLSSLGNMDTGSGNLNVKVS